MSLFLCMVWWCGLMSLIFMWLSNFPNTTCWRDCLVFIVYSCLLCQKLIDHRCVALFLGSLFCSIDSYVCFCANTTLFDYCSFVVSSEVWEGYASCFVVFPQDYFGNPGSFMFHINFRMICFSSVKNVMDNLIGISLNM